MRIEQSRLAFAAIAALVTASCSGPQSSLMPAGDDAQRIDQLFRVMAIGASAVWLAVVAIAVYSIRMSGSHSYHAASLLVLGGGVALPAIVLTALLVYGMPLLPAVLALPADDSLVIHVTGKQWWWRVQYRSPNQTVETANELRLPVGRRIALQLASDDVIHSFWVPSIAGKMDMIPGRVTRLALEPTRTGVFRGACAEYCGASHARMAFDVVVMEANAFRAWLEEQAEPARSAADDLTARGQLLFTTVGCSACHTVRGLSTAGQVGPDLTHVGNRLRLAAGTLPKTRGSFSEWIVQPERFKPGVHMPSFRSLPATDLVALAAFLDSLQ